MCEYNMILPSLVIKLNLIEFVHLTKKKRKQIQTSHANVYRVEIIACQDPKIPINFLCFPNFLLLLHPFQDSSI